MCISSTHAAELHLLLKRVSVSSFCFSAFSVCASPILRRSCPFVLLRPRAACSRSGTCRQLPQGLAVADPGCPGGDEGPGRDALSCAKDRGSFSLLRRSPPGLGWRTAGSLRASRCFETCSAEADKTPRVGVANCRARNKVIL